MIAANTARASAAPGLCHGDARRRPDADFEIAETYSEEAGARAMQRPAGQTHNRATALFSAPATSALGAMGAAAPRAVAVPGDIAVVARRYPGGQNCSA